MQAFVTGSTGLLGSNLVHELVNQGYRVKALVRSMDKAQFLLGDIPQVQFVQGDLQNIPGFAHELRECDLLSLEVTLADMITWYRQAGYL